MNTTDTSVEQIKKKKIAVLKTLNAFYLNRFWFEFYIRAKIIYL